MPDLEIAAYESIGDSVKTTACYQCTLRHSVSVFSVARFLTTPRIHQMSCDRFAGGSPAQQRSMV